MRCSSCLSLLLLCTLSEASEAQVQVSLGVVLPAPCDEAWAVWRAASLAASTVNAAPWFAPAGLLALEPLAAPSGGGAYVLGASFAMRGGAALLAPLDGGAGGVLLAAGAGAVPVLSYAPALPPPPELAPPPLPFCRARGDDEAVALLRLLAAPGWRQAAVLAERGDSWSSTVDALRERMVWGGGEGGGGSGVSLTAVARFSPPNAHGHAEGLAEAVEALFEGDTRVVVLLAGREGGAAAVAALRAAGASGRGWALVGVDDWLGAPGAVWEGAVGVGGHLLDAAALARAALSPEALAQSGAPEPGRPLPPPLAACGAPPPPSAAPPPARTAALAFSAFEAVWRCGAAAAGGSAPARGRPPGWLRDALLRGDAAADFPLLAPAADGFPEKPAWGAGGVARLDAGARTWLNAVSGGRVADVGEGGPLGWGPSAALGAGEAPSDRAPSPHGGGVTLAICLQLLGVALALVAGEVLHQLGLTERVPESLATIAVGALLGVAMRALDGRTLAAAAFSEHFFMLALLPIVIYESGYSLAQGVFFANIRPIAVFAVVGTMVSAAVTSAVIAWGVGTPGWGLPPLSAWECATLGALLSATDPVATLAVFGSLRVEPRLNALTYGESVLNDAIGIVLFRAASAFITAPFSGAALVRAAATAAWILLGAMLWGGLAGAACTAVLNLANVRGLLDKQGRLADLIGRAARALLRGGRGGGVLLLPGARARRAGAPPAAGAPSTPAKAPDAAPGYDDFYALVAMGSTETVFLLVFGYIAFASAEAVGLSGIIAALFCGITQALWATPILSWPGKKVSRAVLKLLAGLADCAIFLQIGLGLALAGDVAGGEVALASVALLGCLLGRAANIFPISTCLNRGYCGRGGAGGAAISWPLQVQMWWAGLRGGIAFASALAFPSQHVGAVARAVAVLCVVTVAVMGPTTVPLLRRLGIRYGVDAEEDRPRAPPRAGGWAERFEQALYGRDTWLQLRDAGAEGIDAAPLFVLTPPTLSPKRAGADISPATAHSPTRAPPQVATPLEIAPDAAGGAPLSPAAGDAAFALAGRARG
jgi:NhaP-type Na+/H+ or K+/H+ antiporter